MQDFIDNPLPFFIGGGLAVILITVGYFAGWRAAENTVPPSSEAIRIQAVERCREKNVGDMNSVLRNPENYSRILEACRAAFDPARTEQPRNEP